LITDLANLGGSLRGTSDLGGGRTKEFGGTAKTRSEKPEAASSFDQILQSKVSQVSTKKPLAALERSDKDVRAYNLKKEPMPVQKKMDSMTPEKAEFDKAEVSSNRNEPRMARKKSNNWDEPGSVKEEKESGTVGRKTNSSSPSREQVMLEFMDSMESEFGIPPSEIVEAMTKIPQSDQLSSPEDSASQVIAQLNLTPAEEQRAYALYMGMLATLQAALESAQPMAESVQAMASAATSPLLADSRQRRNLLNDSLDQMNQKFFMQGPHSPMMSEAQSDRMLNPDGELQQEFVAPLPEFPAQKTDAAAMRALQEQMQQGSVDPLSNEGRELAKALSALSATAAALDQGLKSDPENIQALKAETTLSSMKSPTGEFSSGVTPVAFEMGADEGGGDLQDEGNLQGDSQFFVTDPSAQGGKIDSKVQRGAVNTSFGAALASASGEGTGESESASNVQALMKQAQYMIRKGGGEARIQMTPEGIGQIHMKLAIQDGKVNLEMSAETKEAKKLIESSIHELRSSLGQHNLSVEQVKVDVGNQAAGDNKNSDSQSQQRQMDMRQDQGKNQAREFWSQFGDGGGFDRRGTFFDSPGIRAYGGSSRQVEALTPTSPGAAGTSRYQGSGKGRGLNLVA
jgi:flagellar hook-length control protein FliK